jgi:dUTP pyrophosphatase
MERTTFYPPVDEIMKNIPYYELKIYLDPSIVDSSTINNYNEKLAEIRKKIRDIYIGKPYALDAGFDLFVPSDVTITAGTIGKKVNHGIKCSMTFIDCTTNMVLPTAYYLYPRSSTGSKTPLRLSNSVGIIDVGYRGYIIALFDNINCIRYTDKGKNNDYTISHNDRVVQICGSNITYPILPKLVSSVDDLGITERGDCSFGSTGK